MTGNKTKWSRAELAILRRDYPTIGVAGAAKNLPGRSVYAVKTKAGHLGLTAMRCNAWSADEIELLRIHYQEGGYRQAALHLPHKTDKAIGTRARILGIRRVYKPKPTKGLPRADAWTEAEIAVLQKHYAELGPSGCLPMLPGRSQNSIRIHARKIDLRCRPERVRKSEPRPFVPDDQDDQPIVRVHQPVGAWRAEPVTAVNSIFNLAAA